MPTILILYDFYILLYAIYYFSVQIISMNARYAAFMWLDVCRKCPVCIPNSVFFNWNVTIELINWISDI